MLEHDERVEEMNYYPYYYRGAVPPYHYYPQPPSCPCGHMPVMPPDENRYLAPPGGTPFVNTYHHLEEEPSRQNDQGKKPFVVDIEHAAEQNNNFRTALWTGDHLQVTLMSINVGEDIGLEVHPDTDQFLRIEEGRGRVEMGASEETLNFKRNVKEDDAIMVPAGTWHNITNTGRKPLKLYSIYAPPEHPFGTIHQTKADET